ncbi:MAG: aminopeptidase [Planctomycetes bacterium]|nr:aminopeptidase [Planctomycetota bacterium]
MLTAALLLPLLLQDPGNRPRVRETGITIGRLPVGKLNAITDVAGVRVGHVTLIEGDAIRTGVTVILPHGGNPFRGKVPAAAVIGNGYGKLVGYTQIKELGELESPIALTNTLNVGKVADALVGWVLAQKGNERVRSVNVVVGETNDGVLNDIRGRHVEAEHVLKAIATARDGPVAEGTVGAGTGTRCFGYKGGIGTSSRLVAGYTVGALVQTNFGGTLRIAGREVPASALEKRDDRDPEEGSCMMVLATDAPLCARNLERLARRALAGMARTGASFSNGSGDYVIAFSTAESLRIRSPAKSPLTGGSVLRNDRTSALFVAAAEATEEAILNSMFRATAVESKSGKARALPVDRVIDWWKKQ